MGIYTDKFRQLTDHIPSTPDKFPDPIRASQWTATMRNAALQIIVSLEEELEDEQAKVLDLENRLLEGSSTPAWSGWKKE